MSATRQPAPSWAPRIKGSPYRKVNKLRAHATLRHFRQFMSPGESLFWRQRPAHFPVQEMLSGRMANRYSNKGL